MTKRKPPTLEKFVDRWRLEPLPREHKESVAEGEDARRRSAGKRAVFCTLFGMYPDSLIRIHNSGRVSSSPLDLMGLPPEVMRPDQRGVIVESAFSSINPFVRGTQTRAQHYGAGVVYPCPDGKLSLIGGGSAPVHVDWQFLLACAHHLRGISSDTEQASPTPPVASLPSSQVLGSPRLELADIDAILADAEIRPPS